MKHIPPKAEVRATQFVIRAIDHPLRQRILALLYREKRKLAYNEIAELLGAKDNSLIARHLKVLVGAALVGNHLERGEGRLRSLYFLSESGAAWLRKVDLASPARAKILLEA
jgi:DNA-binding IclR family transcriptional regulator